MNSQIFPFEFLHCKKFKTISTSNTVIKMNLYSRFKRISIKWPIMKKYRMILLMLAVIAYLFYCNTVKSESRKSSQDIESQSQADVVIVAVSCGRHGLNELLAMVKSAILFQKSSKLHFILFVSLEEQEIVYEQVGNYHLKKGTFTYEIRQEYYPEHLKKWRNKFGPCASAKLFLNDALPKTEKVLFVDTDMLFLTDIEDIWQQFTLFNSSQIMGAIPASTKNVKVTYRKGTKFPFYGKHGLNSGVLLMNLKRMRQFNWTEAVTQMGEKYESVMRYFDQDVINVIFHDNPDKLYVLSCTYNYKPLHCVTQPGICDDANSDGIKILHGHSHTFSWSGIGYHQPIFKIMYEGFVKYELGTDPNENLIKPLKKAVETIRDTPCGRLRQHFFKNLPKSITDANTQAT